MRELVYRIPEFRGKNWALRTIDAICGPFSIEAAKQVKLKGFLASPQDAALCQSSGDNPQLIREIQSLPKHANFVDCGANSGFYSALAAKHFGDEGNVISIEPSFREFSRLQWARQNNLHECTWLTVFAGAAESPGIARINTTIGHTGTNRLAEISEKCFDCCPLVTLDYVLEHYFPQDSKIDLIKIDVEGFEMSALRGAHQALKNARIDKLYVEITDRYLKNCGTSKDELYVFMRECGYLPTVNSQEWQYDEVFVPQGLS